MKAKSYSKKSDGSSVLLYQLGITSVCVLLVWSILQPSSSSYHTLTHLWSLPIFVLLNNEYCYVFRPIFIDLYIYISYCIILQGLVFFVALYLTSFLLKLLNFFNNVFCGFYHNKIYVPTVVIHICHLENFRHFF